jgi:hypothetical protein
MLFPGTVRINGWLKNNWQAESVVVSIEEKQRKEAEEELLLFFLLFIFY